MKKSLIVLIVSFSLFSQDISGVGQQDQNYLQGGFGYSWINGEPYLTFSLSPELSFGKIGVGLNIELMFSQNNDLKFRKDMYEGGAGWLRAIRYIRYGHKGDSVFARIGTLDNGTLGNGFMMFHYNNAANYDDRKMGFQFDLDFGDYGFETLYSNFGRPEILGLRGYYRPLADSGIPVAETVEVGLSYVTDFDPNPNDSVDASLAGINLDIGFYPVKNDIFRWKFYFDYGKFFDYGSGAAFGSSFILPNLIGVLEFGVKYERRLLGDQFVPSLFDMSYELNKVSVGGTHVLESAQGFNGNFGELAISVLGSFFVHGNYSKSDGSIHDGKFYSELSIPGLTPPIDFSARYYKSGLDGLTDLFSFDTRSVAELELGYEIAPYTYLTTTYRKNWVEVVDENSGITTYEGQETIIPQVKFRYTF